MADAQAPEQTARVRASALSLSVAIALVALKAGAYALTGSAAILSDALESMTNVVAALFALGAVLFAGRPADPIHPYGHGKLEYVSAAFEGGLIALAAVLIVGYAVRDLVLGPDVRAAEVGLLLTAAAGGVNAALGWHLVRIGRRVRSLILVADGQHVLSDFWTSAGVVMGLLLVTITGHAWLDPLAALVVGVNLARTGWELVRHAAGGLLDEEDTGLMERIVAAAETCRVPGIIRLHRLRAIRSGRFTHVDGNLVVPEFWSVEQAHDASDAFAARALRDCDVDGELAFHTDPCRRALCARCDLGDCPVRRVPFAGRPPLTLAEARQTDEAIWHQVRDPR